MRSGRRADAGRSHRAIRSAVLAAAGVLLLGGCGVLAEPTSSGSTGQRGRPAADSLSLPPPTPTATRRPRPRAIPLDRVAPCQLLTAAQRRQLGYDRPPKPSTDTHFGDAKACAFGNSAEAVDGQLALITSSSIEVWTDQTAQVDTAQIQVAGFPALLVKTPGIEDACNVEVDTTDGQFLDVLADDGGHRTPPPQQVFCQRARTLAEAAMTSLESG